MLSPDALTPGHMLVLDFDGTLVDLAPTPTSIIVPDLLPQMLRQLFNLMDGGLAIVTGRPVKEIEDFLDLPHELIVAGVHGAEWRDARIDEPLAIQQTLKRIADDLERHFAGYLLERKSFAVAIHYRDRSEAKEDISNFLKDALAGQDELAVIAGKSVFEIKPRWANKGEAVRKLLTRDKLKSRIPVMAGDDVTDEDGFRASLDHGGHAIKVGEGDTIANWRIGSPAKFNQWLQLVIENLKHSAEKRANS